MVHPALLPLMPTTRLSAVDWTDAPADLNGIVHYGERRNLVSAHVPLCFKRSLPVRTAMDRISVWSTHKMFCLQLETYVVNTKPMVNVSLRRIALTQRTTKSGRGGTVFDWQQLRICRCGMRGGGAFVVEVT